MYFGLIKPTSDWYHSEIASRRFSVLSFVTLLTWTCFLVLHYRSLLLIQLRAAPIGNPIILCLGLAFAFCWLGLTIGMGWYFLKLDTSPFRVKVFWIVVAFFLSPLAEAAYFLFVYRKNLRRSQVTHS